MRAGIVRRAALTGRLCRSQAAPVVVMAAPPGYGKTTALALWAAQDRRPFAWLSADRSCSDPAVLLTCLARALAAVIPVGQSVFDGLARPAPAGTRGGSDRAGLRGPPVAAAVRARRRRGASGQRRRGRRDARGPWQITFPRALSWSWPGAGNRPWGSPGCVRRAGSWTSGRTTCGWACQKRVSCSRRAGVRLSEPGLARPGGPDRGMGGWPVSRRHRGQRGRVPALWRGRVRRRRPPAHRLHQGRVPRPPPGRRRALPHPDIGAR